MKLGVALTTINIPTALELYAKQSSDVSIFIAGDHKTPAEAADFCAKLNNWVGRDDACVYLSPETQSAFGYKCSDLLGWSNIGRRNIAVLEALRHGAAAVVYLDDDNHCLNQTYFEHFRDAFYGEFNGLQATSPSNWFDVGQLLDPIAPHRGFPHVKRGETTFVSTVGRRVGVAAGICLGDPDISAVTRIANAPVVHRVSELLRAGIVVDPTTTWTVFNSQNTAIIRELAPAFFMVPQWGRYDDIFASLLVQRVARERDYHIHYGFPFVWQTRNQHDLLKDLRAEQFGAERILDFTAWLDGFIFTGKEAVADCMRILFTNLPDWMPERGKIQEMVLAWCDDVGSVMK